ncbi:MAG: hypothetical protein AAF500_16525 [Myxococcota bacterium]
MSHKSSRIRPTVYALATLVAAFVVSVLIVAGATRWLPEGRAGIDHIVVPIIVFPIIWIVLSVSLYAARRPRRAWAITGAVALINIGLAGYGFFVP